MILSQIYHVLSVSYQALFGGRMISKYVLVKLIMPPFLAPDNEGTEFIFAFGSNHPNYDGNLEVFVTTKSLLPVGFNYTIGNETQVK